MVFQSTSEEVTICFPFCWLGSVDPAKLIFYSIIWDAFIIVCWFIYNIFMLELFTSLPLLVSFVLALILFPVVWDIRDPKGQFKILQFYNLIRIIEAVLLSLGALASFVLVFVYIANPSLETTLMHRYFSIGLTVYLFPASCIHWGTVVSFKRALRLMRSLSMEELITTRLDLAGAAQNTPLTQNVFLKDQDALKKSEKTTSNINNSFGKRINFAT